MESSMADYELGDVLRGALGQRAARRRAVERVPDRATAPRCSSPATPIRCSPGCAPRWAGPSWRATSATPPMRPAARNMDELDAIDRRVDARRSPATTCSRPLERARRSGRPDLHRARHARRPALPRPRHGAADAVVPGLGRADDRRRPALRRHARARSATPARASAQHTVDVLRDVAGLTADEIAELRVGPACSPD